jgi:hypothetical protein
VDFWLGTDRAAWLGKTDVPLFVSRRTLATRTRLPRAAGPWALDSSAFTEIQHHGAFQVSAKTYAAEIARYAQDIGGLAWAAPQDWMCEPFILRQTGLTVAEHQRRTVAGYLELRAYTALVVPVVQGWHADEYEGHVEQYDRAGVDLRRAPLVGVGSVCRRQDMGTGHRIVERLWGLGLRLHGFGVKLTGLTRFAHLMASADSMAWSFGARRRRITLPGCAHRGPCNHCLTYALRWRQRILRAIQTPKNWPLL